VAAALKQHALVRGVRVEVHTAGTTEEAKLQAQKRAESTRDYLVKQGVSFDTITPTVVTGSQPLDPGDATSSERTEFHLDITEPATAPVQAPPVEPEGGDDGKEGGDGGFDFSEGGE